MTVSIVYTNHRGETATRRVNPHRLWFGSSPWHSGEQWFLDAYDFDRLETRTFAMKDITAWAPAEGLVRTP